jgi:hypothetical protein
MLSVAIKVHQIPPSGNPGSESASDSPIRACGACQSHNRLHGSIPRQPASAGEASADQTRSELEKVQKKKELTIAKFAELL